MSKAPLQQGQTVFMNWRADRPTQQRPLERLVVVKVGRKWATLQRPDARPGSEQWRADAATLEMESNNIGYGTPGQIYRSEEEFVAERDAQRAWTDLRRALDAKHFTPEGVSAQDILAARTLLGLVR